MNADVCNILFIQHTRFKCSSVCSIPLQVVQKYKDTLQARKSISSEHASFPSTVRSNSVTKSFSDLVLQVPGILDYNGYIHTYVHTGFCMQECRNSLASVGPAS